MTDNEYIEEDWERLPEMDRMYLMERENELWEEYQEWCDERDRLPAKVTVIIEGKTSLIHKKDGKVRKMGEV